MNKDLTRNGLYLHVVFRGNNKQMIFENDRDRVHFLELLEKYVEQFSLTVLAYCLMDNHVHLLVYNPNGELSAFMHQLLTAYAMYFNMKYERVGHLLQNRFFSREIKTDSQLVETFLYILRNPQKAGICDACTYRWSSIHEYELSNGVTDPSTLRKLIGNTEALATLLGEPDAKHFFLEDIPLKNNDDRVTDFIIGYFHLQSGLEVNELPRSRRNEIILTLKEMGVTNAQIIRVTGVNRGAIERACKRVK